MKIIDFILLSLIAALVLCLSGCQMDSSLAAPVADVTVPSVAPIEHVTVTSTVPPPQDLLGKINMQEAKIADLLEAQKELNAQRQELAAKEAAAQAELNNKAAALKAMLDRDAATDQAKINREKAEQETQNRIAAARAEDDIKQKAADAAMGRNIAYAVAGIGIAAILGGAAVCIVMREYYIGGGIAGLGLLLLLLSMNLVALAEPVKWAIEAFLVMGVFGGAAAVITTIRWNWNTNKQADANNKKALEAVAAGDTETAALHVAAAQALSHVAAPGYKATESSVSTKALALLNSAKDEAEKVLNINVGGA